MLAEAGCDDISSRSKDLYNETINLQNNDLNTISRVLLLRITYGGITIMSTKCDILIVHLHRVYLCNLQDDPQIKAEPNRVSSITNRIFTMTPFTNVSSSMDYNTIIN